jgi:GT2 family glycosyltransferase
MKKVAVLLVLYNEEKYIKPLSESLQAQSYKNICYYALDNSSSDKSAALLKKYLPTVKLFRSEENWGFAKGNNFLAQKANDLGCDYLFVLNTDMVVDQACIEELVKLAESNNEVGAISPMVFFGHASSKGKSVIQSFDINISFQSGEVINTYTNQILEDLNLPEKQEVNFMHGGALFFKNEVYNEIGLFEEENFMYGDELEFAYKFSLTKYKMLVTQKAKVWHYHVWSKSNKEGYYFEYYYIKRNKALFYYRHNQYRNILIYVFKEIIFLPVKIRWALRIADLKLIKYYYWGIWDGIRKKNGKATINFS